MWSFLVGSFIDAWLCGLAASKASSSVDYQKVFTRYRGRNQYILLCNFARLSWTCVSSPCSLFVSPSGGFEVDARVACCCLSSSSNSIIR